MKTEDLIASLTEDLRPVRRVRSPVLASMVSDRTGIPAAHIEKDFWVTEVLRES